MDNKRQGLIDFYACVLKTAGLDVTPDGRILHKNSPWLIDGKKAVLPTTVNISTYNSGNILFNVAKENPIASSNVVFSALHKAFSATVDLVAMTCFIEAVKLIVEPPENKLVSHDHLELLSLVSAPDTKLLSTALSLISKMTKASEPFLKFTLHRGRMSKRTGMRMSRVMIVSCNFLNYIDSEQESLRKKDIIALKAIAQYLFPIACPADSYEIAECSSISDTGPSLDVLIQAYTAVCSMLVDFVNLFKQFSQELKQITFDTCIGSVSLPMMRDVIMSTPNHESIPRSNVKDIAVQATHPVIQTAQPVQAAPVHQGEIVHQHVNSAPQPVQPVQTKLAAWSDSQARMNRPVQQPYIPGHFAPAAPMHPINQYNGYPAPHQPQVIYPQNQPQMYPIPSQAPQVYYPNQPVQVSPYPYPQNLNVPVGMKRP